MDRIWVTGGEERTAQVKVAGCVGWGGQVKKPGADWGWTLVLEDEVKVRL